MAQTWTPHRVLRSSEALRSDRGALVERMETDGYLFLRGALPVAAVADLRRSVLAVLHEHGFVDDDGVEEPGRARTWRRRHASTRAARSPAVAAVRCRPRGQRVLRRAVR